jgi:hypothetical protein
MLHLMLYHLVTAGIQRPKFTREQINRMIEDTNRGRYYNLDGKLVVGNEPRMTLDDLNRYLQTIDRTSKKISSLSNMIPNLFTLITSLFIR